MRRLLLFHAGAHEVPCAASALEPVPQAIASGPSAFFSQASRAIRRSRRREARGSSIQRFNTLTLQRKAVAQYFRRMWLGRIFSSVRYLATVRRAIGMPRSLRISTISLSLKGDAPFSLFTQSMIASFTLVLLIDSPVAVW